MSEPKFTKGPWIAAETRHSWNRVIRDADGAPIALTQVAGYGSPTANANAHLIASAPALYEALEELVEAAERVVGEHNAPHDCWSMGPSTGDPIKDYVICPGCVLLNEAIAARSALAQARGERP